MRKLLIGLAIVVGAAAGMIFQRPAFAAEQDTQAVRAAAGEFYSALNVLFAGDVGPMERVWSHDDDVTYMGPGGGFRHGWSEVFANWKTQAALKLGGQVGPRDMRITVGRDLAIVSNYEIGENVAPDGKPRKVEIRATNLFRKENGKWKMIGHHTDMLSYLQK